MKKLVIVGLVFFLAAGVVFAQAQRFRNGNFNAQGTSYNAATNTPNGTINVRVTIRGNRITDVVASNYTDSSAFVSMAMAQMRAPLLAATTPEAVMAVDLVSGATYTALGIRQAVAAAMTQARR